MSAWDDGDDVVPGVRPLLQPHDFPPPSATVQVDFGARSRRGPSHTVNEDHYAVIRIGRHQEMLHTSLPEASIVDRFDEYGYAMVVADAVGGPDGGAASHLAIATLVQLVRHFGKWNLRIDEAIAREIMARAERFVRHVDSTVLYERRKEASRTNQTTLTATFGAGHDLFFVHVGHSRAYLWRRGQLMRLTRDHTTGQGQPHATPAGPLVDVNVTARDLKHILTDTLGMGGPYGPMIDLERLLLDDQDRVLVCTNGLTDIVDDAGIAAILASDQSPDDQCRALVDLAMASGGDDDATALVAHYRLPG